jgi:hypothetical protein
LYSLLGWSCCRWRCLGNSNQVTLSLFLSFSLSFSFSFSLSFSLSLFLSLSLFFNSNLLRLWFFCY